MTYYVYRVEKVTDCKNNATSLEHDYSEDFERYTKLRGYVKLDYYITDSSDLKPGEVYFRGVQLEKQIRKLSLSIYDEEDALDILEDETGSKRYKKHLEQMQTYKTKREKVIKRLEEINNTIKQ